MLNRDKTLKLLSGFTFGLIVMSLVFYYSEDKLNSFFIVLTIASLFYIASIGYKDANSNKSSKIDKT